MAGDFLCVVEKPHKGPKPTPRRKCGSRPNGTLATQAPKKETKAPRWVAPKSLQQAARQASTLHGEFEGLVETARSAFSSIHARTSESRQATLFAPILIRAGKRWSRSHRQIVIEDTGISRCSSLASIKRSGGSWSWRFTSRTRLRSNERLHAQIAA